MPVEGAEIPPRFVHVCQFNNSWSKHQTKQQPLNQPQGYIVMMPWDVPSNSSTKNFVGNYAKTVKLMRWELPVTNLQDEKLIHWFQNWHNLQFN